MSRETYSRNEYTVGWVCALPKEQTAAVAMLDLRHNLPHDMQKSKHDSNTYTLGCIGTHNVVVACLPMGGYGTVSAAIVVAHMTETFPAVRFGLMVGIGGGIPPIVRLGDVVVSIPGHGYPGVVQWDLGKVEDGTRFKRIGSLDKPPVFLRTALSTLQAEQDLEGSKMQTYLQDWQKKYPKSAPKYMRTDALQDILFEAEYSHVQSPDYKPKRLEDEPDPTEESCLHCDRKHAIERKLLGTKVHYGLIASGNSVIKDAAFRDSLNESYDGNILCVEMEAAGLMDNFPCIVIRGICDYADTHKNKAWQEYAAAISAAFAKELLGYVQLRDIVQQQPAKEIIVSHITEIKEDVAYIRSKRDKDEVFNWLAPFNYGSRHSEILRKRHPKTNQWFLEHDKFVQWTDDEGTTLYCPGIQGSGKTVLTSTIVCDLESKFQDRTDVVVAYIYCNYKLPVTIEGYLSSLLWQLIARQPSVPKTVKALYGMHKDKKTEATHQELTNVLKSMLADFSRAFFIVDALDECTKDGNCMWLLISTVLDLQKACQINIFATSRIVGEIKGALANSSIIEVTADSHDMEEYLRSQILLERDGLFDDEFREEVISKVIKAADGMFLLAELHMNSLRGLPTRGHIKQVTSNLITASDRLDSAYQRTLERIENQGDECSKLAYQALAWAVYAITPLHIRAMLQALAIQPGMRYFDASFQPSPKKLLSICAGLITCNDDGFVRLIHYTTQEYLTKVENKWYPNAQANLTRLCVNYLSFGDFDQGAILGTWDYDQRLLRHPFYQYAVAYWGTHARKSPSCDWKNIVSFLQKQAHVEAACLELMGSRRYSFREANKAYEYLMSGSDRKARETLEDTGLHLAAYFGLEEVVRILCDECSGFDVNSKGVDGQTPLSWAARNGEDAVVKQLLARGADVRIGDVLPPILVALDNRHESTVNLLWDAEKKDANSLAQYSPQLPEIVRFYLLPDFLPQFDPEEKTFLLIKEVCLSNNSGKIKNETKDIIKAILADDTIDPNMESILGQTPLLAAIEVAGSDLAIVEILLSSNRVNPNCGFTTPLELAIRKGREDILLRFEKLLSEAEGERAKDNGKRR
ncbi:uncharacterized protein GGS22DRAFT_197275 [Annulohypoxylon maeteangense]|uniref:uncharacterized protein n=1 Tax=Annulohypoxylon maeteangense TaxID=1927788 RepID=UPI0020087FA1|nr:uncharacterized protein GGS22DRAFT_197275 [Annulohypoxylon maeteangense]KAI0880955.1 hypothetical protein GGS22DRAFT_197275 [Annulohypoxylon maeteangense]